MNRIIGFDLGTKTLGIAISDELGLTSHGYENFNFQENAYRQALNHATEIIKREDIKEVVIGLPLNMDGSQGDSARRCLKFKEELSKLNPGLIIEMIDERLTTMMASSFLLQADLSRNKRKKVIDKQSAVMILDTYMSRKKNGF